MLGVDPLGLHKSGHTSEITTEERRILEILTDDSDGGSARGRTEDTGGIPVTWKIVGDPSHRRHDVLERKGQGGAGPNLSTNTTPRESHTIVGVREGGNAASSTLAAGASELGGTIADFA